MLTTTVQIEFIPMLDILRNRYTPENLPYHFVIPSLPGYTFSSPQPPDKDLSQPDASRIFDSLAQAIGLGDGYLVQGGDVGSRVARVMGVNHEACKGDLAPCWKDPMSTDSAQAFT